MSNGPWQDVWLAHGKRSITKPPAMAMQGRSVPFLRIFLMTGGAVSERPAYDHNLSGATHQRLRAGSDGGGHRDVLQSVGDASPLPPGEGVSRAAGEPPHDVSRQADDAPRFLKDGSQGCFITIPFLERVLIFMKREFDWLCKIA